MMKIQKSLLPFGVAGAAIVSVGWANPAHALVTVGTDLYDPVTNNFVQPSGISNTQFKAVAFTTDNSSWTLDAVRLSLTGFDSGDSPLIQIREDNAGDPGAALVDLGNPNPVPTSSGAIRNFTFTPTAAFTFNANTTYWLVLTATTASIYNWAELENNSVPPASTTQPWSFVGYEVQNETNPTWTSSSIQNAFQIEATEITPIPFAFTPIPGLIVSGIIGGVRRARNKAKRTVEA